MSVRLGCLLDGRARYYQSLLVQWPFDIDDSLLENGVCVLLRVLGSNDAMFCDQRLRTFQSPKSQFKQKTVYPGKKEPYDLPKTGVWSRASDWSRIPYSVFRIAY